MNPLIQLKTTTILPVLIALTLGCFALSPNARAACQQGCRTTQNTVLGDDALINNTTGNANTATGFNALLSNTTGFSNTATGALSLNSNTTGNSNTATGYVALQFNTTGSSNTAIGVAALLNNTTGQENIAIGQGALLSNNGNSNTATGPSALQNNTTGSFNTAYGESGLVNNTTGSNNIALGFNAASSLTTGGNNIDIGNVGIAGESFTMRIGGPFQAKTFIAGIRSTPISGVAVGITTDGQLGVRASAKRFKEAIKPMDKASEAILALKPVTFRYKHELDPKGIPQFGLVAEDVEKVNPDLVARDEEGKPYTVRYEAVNAMLLNEFLKEHGKNEEQEATIARLQKQVDALTAGLQKVSAQLEVNKPAPQTVLNNQ